MWWEEEEEGDGVLSVGEVVIWGIGGDRGEGGKFIKDWEEQATGKASVWESVSLKGKVNSWNNTSLDVDTLRAKM
jgi:hypothetical protein